MIGYSPLLVRRCWRSTRAAKKAGPTPPATTDSRRPPRGWQRLRPLHDTGAWERRRHPARHCWGPADGVAVRTRRDRLRHPNRGRWRRIHPGDRLHALSAATGRFAGRPPYDRQPASRPTGTGSTSRSMTGRWWRSTPRMAPSAGVSPLPPRRASSSGLARS